MGDGHGILYVCVVMWSETDAVETDDDGLFVWAPARPGLDMALAVSSNLQRKWNGPSRPLLVPNRFILNHHVLAKTEWLTGMLMQDKKHEWIQ
jgi:hypothetical protein